MEQYSAPLNEDEHMQEIETGRDCVTRNSNVLAFMVVVTNK